jgi:hypothetical protein
MPAQSIGTPAQSIGITCVSICSDMCPLSVFLWLRPMSPHRFHIHTKAHHASRKVIAKVILAVVLALIAA